MKVSQNQYAETLLKAIATKRAGQSERPTQDARWRSDVFTSWNIPARRVRDVGWFRTFALQLRRADDGHDRAATDVSRSRAPRGVPGHAADCGQGRHDLHTDAEDARRRERRREDRLDRQRPVALGFRQDARWRNCSSSRSSRTISSSLPRRSPGSRTSPLRRCRISHADRMVGCFVALGACCSSARCSSSLSSPAPLGWWYRCTVPDVPLSRSAQSHLVAPDQVARRLQSQNPPLPRRRELGGQALGPLRSRNPVPRCGIRRRPAERNKAAFVPAPCWAPRPHPLCQSDRSPQIPADYAARRRSR